MVLFGECLLQMPAKHRASLSPLSFCCCCCCNSEATVVKYSVHKMKYMWACTYVICCSESEKDASCSKLGRTPDLFPSGSSFVPQVWVNTHDHSVSQGLQWLVDFVACCRNIAFSSVFQTRVQKTNAYIILKKSERCTSLLVILQRSFSYKQHHW